MKSLILISLFLSFGLLANAASLSRRVLDECSGPTYWNAATSNCDACPANCQVCSLDTGSLLCSGCYGGYAVNEDNTACVLAENSEAAQQSHDCWQGAYWSAAENRCDSCPDANCKTCEQNALNAEIFCSACYESWAVSADGKSCVENLPTGQQSTSCWNGAYWNAERGLCDNCPENCKTCEQNGLNGNVYCSECYLSWRVSEDQLSCVSDAPRTCWEGAYWSDPQNMCADCPDNCKTCAQNAEDGVVYCSECYFSWAVSEDRISCVDASSSGQQSTTCWEGTYWSEASNSCASCVAGCKSCVQNPDSGNVVCSECYQGSVLNADGSACNDASSTIRENPNCWSGSYLNAASNTCENCPNNCETCNVDQTSNALVCSVCYGGYTLSADFTSCD